MSSAAERLNAEIEKNLRRADIRTEVYGTLTSTNDRARELALSGANANTLVVAVSQTAGRGRQGRSFFSPAGGGIYMSLLLRPESLDKPERITVAAAVAAACALEKISGKETKIKWVNDVFVDGKKVSGILTEGGSSADGRPWAVLGVGVNLSAPEEGFPEELRAIAGAVLPESTTEQRGALIAEIAETFLDIYEDPDENALYDAYCARDLLHGNIVNIIYNNEETEAIALGIDRDFSLRVRLPDGREISLRSGEARARPAK